MLEFIEQAIKLLVDKPDEVNIEIVETEQRLIYELTVGEGDYGKVIGKGGRNISALRTLVFAINAKEGGKRARLDVIDQMKNLVHPIATITTTSGLTGDVRLRPLSRYFDDYIEDKKLMLGFSPDTSEDVRLEIVTGMGKKRRFKFEGVDTVSDAEKIVGQTIFIEASREDQINMIGKDLLGYEVFAESGDLVGILKDVMWLPHSDVYVITNGGKEFLIPVIPEVVKGINHEQGVIVISPMEGLLD